MTASGPHSARLFTMPAMTPVKSAAQLVTLPSGWLAWQMPDGRLRPHITGAEDPPAPPPGPPAPPAPPADLGALQQAIDAAKNEGSTTAQTELLKALGFDKLEDAQAFVTAKREADDAKKTEEQRAREAAEQAAAEARAAAEKANTVALNARVRAQLVVSGAPGENVADLARLVEVADDADDTALAAAVDAVKTKFPALFTAAGRPPAPPGTPPGAPPAPPAPRDGVDPARERAMKRHGVKTPASA